MIKRIIKNTVVFLVLILCQTAFAKAEQSGLLFNIKGTGDLGGTANITLCLNAKGLLSCQHYTVTNTNLSITTTIPNHTYLAAGIIVNTPGYKINTSSCILISNGYCLFSVNNQTPTTISITTIAVRLTAIPSTNTEVGVAYSQTNVASGGTVPYTYSVLAGTVPVGTALNTSTGTVSGTPTTADVFSYTIQVTDNDGLTAIVMTTGTIAKTSQTITYTSMPPSPTLVGESYIPIATSTSGLTVSITVDSSSGSVCSISGSTVTFNAAGICTLDADQVGSTQYSAAPQVQQNIMVHPVVPGAPTSVTASAGDASATLSWSEPTRTGGVAITNYVITPYIGVTAQPTITVGNVLTTNIAGLTNNSAYTFTVSAINIVGTGPVSAASTAVTPLNDGTYTVPAFPQTVIATAGYGEVTLTWSAPNNPGNGAVTGYTVLYGVTSTTNPLYTTPALNCQQSSATTCTVTGLTNGISYTFTVSATNASGTGPVAYSSPAIPLATGLNANPLTLALSGLGAGAERVITITNNLTNAVTGVSVGIPTPLLPVPAALDTTSPDDCSKVNTLSADGGSCTITINPGLTATSTSGCTDGTTLPTPSQITVNTSSGSVYAYVVILGYGCQYQGGYLFSIYDTTPTTSSIGGLVAAASDQIPSTPGIFWNSVSDTIIWGIDEFSTISIPLPNAESSATLIPGQLNCNGNLDGACNTNNIILSNSPPLTSYAAGICKQSIDSSGNTPCVSSDCYIDWYLPSICEMGYQGLNSQDSQCGIPPAPPTIQNMQSNLVDNLSLINDVYWSSTEDSASSTTSVSAWYQVFTFEGSIQAQAGASDTSFAVRCARALTL